MAHRKMKWVRAHRSSFLPTKAIRTVTPITKPSRTMKKTLILILLVGFLFAGFGASAQWTILVNNPPKTSLPSTYVFDNGQQQLGGVIWEAPGGTINSTSANGSQYSASITYGSTGSKTITLKNAFSQTVVGSITVTRSG